MNTAITERATEAAQGWVLYDGECQFCLDIVARSAAMFHRHHFQLAPLQAPWVRQQLDLKPGEPLVEMKLLAGDGIICSGADALVQIARRIWWAWPLFAVAQIPGAMILCRAIYRRIAANRSCLGGTCPAKKPSARHHTVRTFLEMP